MKRTIIILLFCLVQSTNDSSSIEWMNSVINQRFLNISKWKCSVLARLQTTFLRFSLELLQVQVEFFVIASHFVILLEKKNYLVNLALCPAFSLV